jgi:hypothetical protein
MVRPCWSRTAHRKRRQARSANRLAGRFDILHRTVGCQPTYGLPWNRRACPPAPCHLRTKLDRPGAAEDQRALRRRAPSIRRRRWTEVAHRQTQTAQFRGLLRRR